jgi:hypothetical protein
MVRKSHQATKQGHKASVVFMRAFGVIYLLASASCAVNGVAFWWMLDFQDRPKRDARNTDFGPILVRFRRGSGVGRMNDGQRL